MNSDFVRDKTSQLAGNQPAERPLSAGGVEAVRRTSAGSALGGGGDGDGRQREYVISDHR